MVRCAICNLKMDQNSLTACLLATLEMTLVPVSLLQTVLMVRSSETVNSSTILPTTLAAESAPQGAAQPQLIVCSETTTPPRVVVSTSTMAIPRPSAALLCVETLQTTSQVLGPSTIRATTSLPHLVMPATAMATAFLMLMKSTAVPTTATPMECLTNVKLLPATVTATAFLMSARPFRTVITMVSQTAKLLLAAHKTVIKTECPTAARAALVSPIPSRMPKLWMPTAP